MASRTRVRAYLALMALFVVVGTCLRLSWWQLERAEEKRLWLDSQQQKAALPPANLATLLANDTPQHHRAQFFGEIDNRHPILLDNRTLNRVAGYHLLSPMQADSGHWVLINRGWLPRGPSRDVLPTIPAIDGRIQVEGTVYQSPGEAFVLKDEQLPDNQWPLRVQKVDFHAISEKLGVELAPFEIRVTPELALGGRDPLPRHWQDITVMGPQQHKAYALQWLALAIAALVIFLFAGTRAQKRRLTGKPQ